MPEAVGKDDAADEVAETFYELHVVAYAGGEGQLPVSLETAEAVIAEEAAEETAEAEVAEEADMAEPERVADGNDEAVYTEDIVLGVVPLELPVL